MPIRMKDIARDLGISVVTVSKALRNRPDISTETRALVLRRSEELNYRPNLSARSLVTGRTNMMGLVIPDLAHEFFSELARGMSGVLRRASFTLLISSSEQHPELERQVIDQLIDRRVDALLIASTQFTPQTFQQVAKEGIPYILLDRRFEGFASHFVGEGCMRALAEHGLALGPEYVATTGRVDETGEGAGYDAANELLRLAPRPDAIFCYNDPVAVGAMQAILDAGLRIPADIALLGCGNIHFDDYLRVPLSSMDQQSAAIGVCAARLAIDLVNSGRAVRPKVILLEPKLIPRDSTRLTA